MRLDDSLERLANRGPHCDPLAVIALARGGSSVLDGGDSLAEIIDLETADDVGRRRRVLALTAAAALVILVGTAGIIMRNRAGHRL